MIASLIGETTMRRVELLKLLKQKNWIPALQQRHPFVEGRRQSIIDALAPDDVHTLTTHRLDTLYHAETRTWGIVGWMGDGRCEFRLQSASVAPLNRATEQLVSDLRGAPDRRVRFGATVQVLEQRNVNPAYTGMVRGVSLLRVSIRRQVNDLLVAGCCLALALALPAIADPQILDVWLAAYEPHARAWARDGLSHASSLSLVTSTVTLLNFVLAYVRLRMSTVIHWTL